VTTVWITIAGLAVGNLVIKGIGPVTLGSWRPSDRAIAVISLLAPALLAALVVYESLAGPSGGVRVDQRLIGVAVAVLALLRRLPMIVVVVLAAAATALVRLI
jgi:hypothetical protein